MNTEKRNYVAVLPDGTEHPFELINYSRDRGFAKHDIEAKLRQVVADAGLRTSRKEPQTVSVQCFQLVINGAALQRNPAGTFQITPPPHRMTQDEFNEEQAELLKFAPEEFHSALSHKAWEDGHSAGYEEVILLLQGLVDWIDAPLKAYTARIQSKKKT